tara:strand:- start:550 stop:1791 length:1242 start_codon:yes stop_codon:yes gene_type:complete
MGARAKVAQLAMENPKATGFLVILSPVLIPLGIALSFASLLFAAVFIPYVIGRILLGFGVCWVINGGDYSFSEDFKFWPFLPICNIKCEKEQCSNNGTGEVTGVIYGDCNCSCDTGYSGDKCQTSVSAPNPPPAPTTPPDAQHTHTGDDNTASADAESSVPSCTGIRRKTSCNAPEHPEDSIQADNCVNGYVVSDTDPTKGYQCYWVGARNSCDAWGSIDRDKTWEERSTKCLVPVTAPPPSPVTAPPPPPAPPPAIDKTHHCVCMKESGGDCCDAGTNCDQSHRRKKHFCTYQHSKDDCENVHTHYSWVSPGTCKWEQIPSCSTGGKILLNTNTTHENHSNWVKSDGKTPMPAKQQICENITAKREPRCGEREGDQCSACYQHVPGQAAYLCKKLTPPQGDRICTIGDKCLL